MDETLKKFQVYLMSLLVHTKDNVLDILKISDKLKAPKAVIWIMVNAMVFKATFNNNSVISLRSVLLVDEIGEHHRPAASH